MNENVAKALSMGQMTDRFETLGDAIRLYVPELADVRESVVAQYQMLRDAPETVKTHLFGGRYENIYIARERIVGLDVILDIATAAAASIASVAAPLSVGFWFNEMQAGHETTLHTHDDDDEILSGVFYLTVPENAGDLLLGEVGEQIAVAPVENAFVFFSPKLPHAVGKNCSDEMRLSIGMNFGVRRDQD